MLWPSGVRRTKNIRNIGIYHPHVIRVRSGFISYVSTTFHVELKGFILPIEFKVIKLINSNKKMDEK